MLQSRPDEHFVTIADIPRAPQYRLRYSLKALLGMLTASAILGAILARFGPRGIVLAAYLAWLLAPLWIPFGIMYFETCDRRDGAPRDHHT